LTKPLPLLILLVAGLAAAAVLAVRAVSPGPGQTARTSPSDEPVDAEAGPLRVPTDRQREVLERGPADSRWSVLEEGVHLSPEALDYALRTIPDEAVEEEKRRRLLKVLRRAENSVVSEGLIALLRPGEMHSTLGVEVLRVLADRPDANLAPVLDGLIRNPATPGEWLHEIPDLVLLARLEPPIGELRAALAAAGEEEDPERKLLLARALVHVDPRGIAPEVDEAIRRETRQEIRVEMIHLCASRPDRPAQDYVAGLAFDEDLGVEERIAAAEGIRGPFDASRYDRLLESAVAAGLPEDLGPALGRALGTVHFEERASRLVRPCGRREPSRGDSSSRTRCVTGGCARPSRR
jgi:hypothetical protein